MNIKQLCLSFCCFAIACGISYSQNDVVKKILLKLQPEESIVTNESCLNFTTSGNEVYLVTWQNQLLYTYENGIRKGPFKKPEEVKIKTCGEDKKIECSVFQQKEQVPPQQYLSVTDDGKYSIKFKDKTYGPFTFIAGFYVAPDNSTFTTVVADEHMSFSLITSEGLNQKLNGTFERFLVSPSGKQYLILVKEGPTMDMAALSNMSEADLMKYMQDMAQAQQNAGEPQTQIIGNGGKLYGKFKSSALSSDNPNFCQTGADNWYMILKNDLYINGTLVRKDDNTINLSTCKIWISSDGKRYAIIDYDKIIFSDGSSYPPPIHLEIEKSGTKTILKWLALENSTDLVSYSKEL